MQLMVKPYIFACKEWKFGYLGIVEFQTEMAAKSYQQDLILRTEPSTATTVIKECQNVNNNSKWETTITAEAQLKI